MPASSNRKGRVSPGSPAVKPSSSDLRPRSGIVVASLDCDALQQQLVDARSVQVDHLDPPVLEFEMLAGVGDAAEVGDHHAGGRVVVVLGLARQGAAAEQLAQVVD